MFKYIIDWISYFFKKEKLPIAEKQSELNKDHDHEIYIGAISFKITPDLDIDVMCALPDIKNSTIDQISVLAEKYADFLLAINEGHLKNDIIEIIQNNVYKSGDPKDTLFLENMLFHWALAHVEYEKKKRNKEKKDQPVIRPISVFNPT
jgi:hypothetical protein